ncbi:MAG: K(+)-transporting ATPase subunit F [Labilithrix sp.]|nr:K(+)-transporting ATPase subunit F [Labilithrix sp.]
MNPLYWIGLIVSIALFGYLFVAMLKPESMG